MSADLRAQLKAARSQASGLEGDALHCSCWRAFRAARDGVGLAVGPEELGDVNEEVAERFKAAVRYAAGEIEASGEAAGKSWSGTALVMGQVLYGEVELTAAQKATLEAAARHAANAMEYCGEEDGLLADLEREWRTWTPRRCGMDAPAPTQLEEGPDDDSISVSDWEAGSR